ncbi:colicin V production protein [Ditylenchus destructor]|nr:colicin V production protein [Ditylenchus destructor]
MNSSRRDELGRRRPGGPARRVGAGRRVARPGFRGDDPRRLGGGLCGVPVRRTGHRALHPDREADPGRDPRDALGVLDRLGGAAFGVLRAVLVALLATVIVDMTPAAQSPAWTESQIAPWLQTTLTQIRPLLPEALKDIVPA